MHFFIRRKSPRALRAFCMARPDGVEPPTAWFVARYSIQLSYGRMGRGLYMKNMKNGAAATHDTSNVLRGISRQVAEREGFEPSMEFCPIRP